VTEEALTFEAAQKELEAIVEKLERGEAELEQLTALSVRGEELYRFCREKLDAAHGRIEELSKGEPDS
jgi:exodeoxyribonuclease VII small subunit